MKKPVQDLEKKLGNMDEKFRREVEVLKQKQTKPRNAGNEKLGQ